MPAHHNPKFPAGYIQKLDIRGYRGLLVQKLPIMELRSYFPLDHTVPEDLEKKLSVYGEIELEIVSTPCAINSRTDPSYPLISIIVPTHNSSAFIDATLQTIVDQNYRPFEVLLVDDGSTDDTADKIRDFISQNCDDLRAKLVKLPNLGNPAAVRNFALYNLLSPDSVFVTFMDDDDLYAGPDRLCMLAHPLIKNMHYMCAYGGYDFINGQGDRLAGPVTLRKMGTDTWKWKSQSKLTWTNLATKRTGAYHLQCFMVRLPSPFLPYYRTGADAIYFARVIKRTAEMCGNKLDGICHIPEVIFHYRKRASSISDSKFSRSDWRRGTKRVGTITRIPTFYFECGIPEKYITRFNVAEFYARKWAPRIYNAVLNRRYRDAARFARRAVEEHSMSAVLLPVVLVRDMIVKFPLRDVLSQLFGKRRWKSKFIKQKTPVSNGK